MLKCLVFVLCAVSLTTIVFCAPSVENIREKQSTREDVTDQLIGASRPKRQTVEVVYLDASSLDTTRIKGFQSKEPRPGPVNVGSNYGQNFQQIPNSNLELVSQNSEFDVYKLNTGDDNPLNGLPGDRRAQNSNNQYYSYDSVQYSGYSGGRNPPPPDYGRPPPPPHRHPPPPPPHRGRPAHHHEGPPPPPPDFGRLTPHGGGPPDRFDRGPPHRPGGGGPPGRYDGRPPGPHGGHPDHYDDRPPHHHHGPPGRRPHPHRDGPDRFDMRPPYNRPPPPPHDHKPPHDREPDGDERDEGNKNNDKPQKDDNTEKVIDETQTSSTTEAEIDDDNYQIDVRFSDDEQKAPETMKRAIPSEKTSARLLSPSPFIYQAAAVRPED